MTNTNTTTLNEKRQDIQDWQARQVRAGRRVDNGRYSYLDPQAEEDGLSAASIDDELGLQLRELAELEPLEHLSTT